MIKTIKVKKEMNFRELMEYIIQNDIRDREFTSRGNEYSFSVCEGGIFDFYCVNYNMGETYEIEVEETITEDTVFECVVINTEELVYSFRHISIKESRHKLPKAIEIFARVDGKLQKIWEREN